MSRLALRAGRARTCHFTGCCGKRQGRGCWRDWQSWRFLHFARRRSTRSTRPLPVCQWAGGPGHVPSTLGRDPQGLGRHACRCKRWPFGWMWTLHQTPPRWQPAAGSSATRPTCCPGKAHLWRRPQTRSSWKVRQRQQQQRQRQQQHPSHAYTRTPGCSVGGRASAAGPGGRAGPVHGRAARAAAGLGEE